MSKYRPTEARLRERVKGSLGEYAHEFGIDGEAAMDEWIDRALAERDNRVRADERAKRPDREQIARALFEADGRRNYDGSPTPWHILDLDEQAHYRKLADAVLSSLALEPEAREEAELFHDQDGDLWKLTDKGEWFHEEEPGEFRQVLSIDAEDQTLTPVGHAELAPAPKATDAEVEAAAIAMIWAVQEGDEFDPPVPLRWPWATNDMDKSHYRQVARVMLEAAREVE